MYQKCRSYLPRSPDFPKLDDNRCIRLDIAQVDIWEENRHPERTIRLDIAISGHIYMKTDIFVKRLNLGQVGIHEKKLISSED